MPTNPETDASRSRSLTFTSCTKTVTAFIVRISAHLWQKKIVYNSETLKQIVISVNCSHLSFMYIYAHTCAHAIYSSNTDLILFALRTIQNTSHDLHYHERCLKKEMFMTYTGWFKALVQYLSTFLGNHLKQKMSNFFIRHCFRVMSFLRWRRFV
jgi:hypothetical protein